MLPNGEKACKIRQFCECARIVYS
ncbi:hypothetical protein KAE72_03935 [Bartonella henselae]|nr:hypothetical protein K8O99_06280 [Bartonella henselae]UJM35172.1 hypothetical protein KAE75_05970 [Bartonella henselae]UJM36666.1 hypothetical protein KAE77_06190 [Bartonella henselae]UJM38131.1 hypothetical protein KAE71_06050 [Bartonella henselae]UJM39560.1 hypothetical protein KAE72_03935 [Bartonella henselae]